LLFSLAQLVYGMGCPTGWMRFAGRPHSGRATPEAAVSGVARLQGVEGWGMAGPGETLGSPWPPLVIRSEASRLSTVSRNVSSQAFSQGRVLWGSRSSWNRIVHLPRGRPLAHFTRARHALLLYALPAIPEVAHPHNRRPTAIFYPFGCPTPCAYVKRSSFQEKTCEESLS
jgi:hypothetical protein